MIEYLYYYLAVAALVLTVRMYMRMWKETVFPGVIGIEAYFALTWPLFTIVTLLKGKPANT